MTPIWLLPSVGRPEAAAKVLEACTKAGMTHPGVLWADGDDYSDVPLPWNWTLMGTPENRGIGPVMNDMLALYPKASYYGWLADDTYPRTPGFDVLLCRAADHWGLAYADDAGYLSAHEHPVVLYGGYNITSGLVWGGPLVRSVGWWALPGLRQAYVDVAWCDIASQSGLGLARYRPDITVEHKNWRTRKRAPDKWDRLTEDWESSAVMLADKNVYTSWKRTGLKPTLARIVRDRRRETEGVLVA